MKDDKKEKKQSKMKFLKKNNIKKTKAKKVATDLNGNVIKGDSAVNKSKKKVDLKGHFKKYKKIYSIILALVMVFALAIVSYICIRNYILNKKYGYYEAVIDRYGFSLMYNNGSPKSSEKVTRIEMVKLVFATIYNATEVESRGFYPRGEFDSDEWARAAVAFGIIDEDYITVDTYDMEATYKEALVTYLKARSKLMDVPVSSNSEASYKNLQSFSLEERQYINDAVENGLLENSNKKLKIDNKLYKGQFNELVAKFVEKYNTVAPEGETLVTKEESKPSNYDIYPYILYSVDKEVYEYKGVSEGEGDYKTPAETYKYKKEYYSQMEYRSEWYYNQILNVNYTTIDKDEFYEKAEKYLRYNRKDEIYDYVDYVKNNKIIIEGKAEVQHPIFYLDGIRYRSRIKLTFEIKNADTDINLLLGDVLRESDVKYKNKKYTVYIDAPMGTTLISKALYIDMEPIIDIMVNDTSASELNEF